MTEGGIPGQGKPTPGGKPFDAPRPGPQGTSGDLGLPDTRRTPDVFTGTPSTPNPIHHRVRPHPAFVTPHSPSVSADVPQQPRTNAGQEEPQSPSQDQPTPPTADSASVSKSTFPIRTMEQRVRVIPPVENIMRSYESSVGTTPEQRADWFLNLQPEALDRFLLDVNAAVQEKEAATHTFDGEGVIAAGGALNISFPPTQQDKISLLHLTLSETQAAARQMLAEGSSAQETLDYAAVVLPTMTNTFHPFEDGNGTATRALRMLIRDGAENSDGVAHLVLKEGPYTYDSTPQALAIDTAISDILREQQGLQAIRIIDDPFSIFLANDILQGFVKTPLDAEVAHCLLDRVHNLGLTLREFERQKHDNVTRAEDLPPAISLKDVIAELSENPDQQQKLIGIYREVRKQRALFWIDAFTGKRDLPIQEEVSRLQNINTQRAKNGQPPLTMMDIDTAIKLQTAYLEAHSPQRAK